jgi:hypothetical protein
MKPKYVNSDPRCRFPCTGDGMDYCWSFAHHVDGTAGYEEMEPRCRGCEYFSIEHGD